MLETTPSVVYSELYNTTNRFLDEAAYRLAMTLHALGKTKEAELFAVGLKHYDEALLVILQGEARRRSCGG